MQVAMCSPKEVNCYYIVRVRFLLKVLVTNFLSENQFHPNIDVRIFCDIKNENKIKRYNKKNMHERDRVFTPNQIIMLPLVYMQQ